MRHVLTGMSLALACTPGSGETTEGGTTTAMTSVTTVGSTSGSTGETTGSTTEAPTTTDSTGGGPPMKCLVIGIAEAFAADPPIDGEGTASCTVVAADPLQLDCQGSITGPLTIDLAASLAPDVMVGEMVELEYRTVGHAEFLETWVRLKSGTAVKLVTTQAMAVAPAGVAEWFPTNVEVGPVEIGCPDVMCVDGSGMSIRKQALSFGQGAEVVELIGGVGGTIPGEFGGEVHEAFVHDARIGACGATLGEQASWYAFSIVRTAGP